ncbi:ABC transporter ATP-binding protein [Polymorphum gilvum]|uniref:ABC transporter related protein n=1 Tax=Polymorphum gilvum (strain LMG 25793 / CGMCC 1.9160 / SL003B-26A1) TaxID=991905 RepID=F2IW13_POLGS|nr:ABC transporter ATP-binding protein [Polymorphum gilvum]ADZ70295.1 ABC transporter related protein [Polymorphum gilvum SL003B-26A1]
MSAILAIEDLVKCFGGLVATDRVSLEVREGEIHALIGPNGAGKSTLINQLCGELAPDSGTIRLAGRDVTRVPTPARVALGLGRTFQITSLLDDMSVRENVGMAVQVRLGHNFRIFDAVRDRRAVWQEADRLIADSALAPRAGVRVADLSHGEKKQLELVVALAMKPRLLLLDEPMAGLGHVESLAMIEMLRRTRESAAMLLVEHDMDAVFALADRISVLVYGKIIATGTVDEIRDDPAVREAYLGAEDELC